MARCCYPRGAHAVPADRNTEVRLTQTMHGACILGLHRYANDAWGMHPRTPPVRKRCMGHAPSDSTGTAPLRTSIKARTACRRASSFPLQISAPGRTRRATAGLRPEEEPPMEHLSQYDSDVEGEVEVHHVTAVPRQALPAVRAEPLVPRARVREPTTPGFVIPVTNRVRRIEAEPAAPKKSRKKKKVRWAKAIEGQQTANSGRGGARSQPPQCA